MVLSPEEVGARILGAIEILREDIARAKSWILKKGGGKTSELVEQWLSEQGVPGHRRVDADEPTCSDVLTMVSRAYSLRKAFYQATWELLSTCDMIPAASNERWSASLEYRTRHGCSGTPLNGIGCSYPQFVELPPLTYTDPSDVDIFLAEVGSKTLHTGIQEAISQSLACFRRGLHMPATVMLAAAAEATWTECGAAVANNLANSKLAGVVSDPFASVGKKVQETRKALEHGDAKDLLKKAGQSVVKVCDAEVWTTVLRDRRNALHWTKAKSFVVDHAGTANLLLAGQMHIGTLESIRNSC